MKKIELDLVSHRGKRVVLIRFERDATLNSIVRQLSGIKWSNTYRAWYVIYSMEVLHELKRLFEHVCLIDASDLKEKLLAYNKDPKNKLLSSEASASINNFNNWMLSRRYSESTIGTYTDALKTFLKFYHHKAVSEITNDDVIRFNNEYILANKLSASFQNQLVNAIKLFYRTMQNTNINAELIHRPKKPRLLPNVLSKEEIKCILTAQGNVKHKTMLSLIYSCGLRRSELLNLKITDIDFNRRLVIIRQSKGRKDRVAHLSDKISEMLKDYIISYKPNFWLFEGQNKQSKYDENSLAAVLKQALQKSGITKPVTLHWLRHSYATHLLENGTDLRYIQEILGHSRSTTTEIYTHVRNKSIQKIISPFDSL